MKYGYNTHIRFSEVDQDLHITLPALITEFQDCGIFHGNHAGQGVTQQRADGHLWLLSSWQIIIDRYPSLYEEIGVATWAWDWKGFFGFRNFTMTDADGALAAYANSIWVYTDLRTGHPARITKEVSDLYGTEPPVDMEIAPRKIALPSERTPADPIVIMPHDIDANGHVNNTRYVEIAQTFLPEGFLTRQLRAEYRTAAKLGDIFYPTISVGQEAGEKKIIVALGDDKRKPYSVIEFIGM